MKNESRQESGSLDTGKTVTPPQYRTPEEQMKSLEMSYLEFQTKTEEDLKRYNINESRRGERVVRLGKPVELRLGEEDSIEVRFTTPDDCLQGSLSSNSITATPHYFGDLSEDHFDEDMGIEFEANGQRVRVPLDYFNKGVASADLNSEGLVYTHWFKRDNQENCQIIFRSKELADTCKQAYAILKRLAAIKPEGE